jgi:NodT family efflux transporter outer membrane factor (OMF) lipoprotein
MNRLILAAALALTGCASVPDRPLPAGAAITAPVAWRSIDEGASTADQTWWQSFGDPQLSAYVEEALRHNPDIGIAASRVEQARTQLDLAASQSLPTLGFTLNAGHSRDLNSQLKPVTQDSGRANVVASYDTDLFGRLRDTTGAARAQLLASQASQEGIHLAVTATTASGYIDLIASQAKLNVLRRGLASRGEALKLASLRADRGYSADLERQQAQAEFDGTDQQVTATLLVISRQENALNVLLGRVPNDLVGVKDIAELAVPVISAGVPSNLLRRRPDIAQAEQGIVSADHNFAAARAAFLPSFTIGLSQGDVNSTLIRDPVGIFNFGGSILAPIFSGGRLTAQANNALARRDEAAFTYQKVALNAFREVDDGLTGQTLLVKQEAQLKSQRQAQAKAYNLAVERYGEGYTSYIEQLDAERGLLAADLALVQIRQDRLKASIGLYQALGGGWQTGTGQAAPQTR